MEMDSSNTGNKVPNKETSGLLTERIVTTVAEADGQSVYELTPLYNVIDPEALNTLFAPHADGSPRPVGEVSFQYLGYWVTVSSEGVVEIETHDP